MSEEIKTGWLKERDGTKFAPTTLISQVVTNDGYNYDQVVKAQMSQLKSEVGENTKEDIAALKTSVNSLEDKVNNISLDELVSADNTLYIVDDAGLIIARIDAQGIHSVNFIIPEKGDLLSYTEMLDASDNTTFYIVDKDNNKIFQVDEEGTKSTDFIIAGQSVKEALAAIKTDINNLKENIGDTIENEGDSFIIADDQENKIFQVDANGTRSTNFIANKEPIEDFKEEANTVSLWGLDARVQTVENTLGGSGTNLTQQVQQNTENIASNKVATEANAASIEEVSGRVTNFEESIDLDDNGEDFKIVDSSGYVLLDANKTDGLVSVDVKARKPIVTNGAVTGYEEDVSLLKENARNNTQDSQISALSTRVSPFEQTFEFSEENEKLEIVDDAGETLAEIDATGIAAKDFKILDADGNIISSLSSLGSTTAEANTTTAFGRIKTNEDKLATLGLPGAVASADSAFGRIKSLEDKTNYLSVGNGITTISSQMLKLDSDSGMNISLNSSQAPGITISITNNGFNYAELYHDRLLLQDLNNNSTIITPTGITATGSVVAESVEAKEFGSEEKELVFTDGTDEKNIIAKIDANGITATYINAMQTLQINNIDIFNLFGNSCSKVGSYLGTGSYGSENPNSLTFDFIPQVLIILKSNVVDELNSVILLKSMDEYQFSDGTTGTLTWENNKITWYSTNAVQQFNTSLQSYYYLALGAKTDNTILQTPYLTLQQVNDI